MNFMSIRLYLCELEHGLIDLKMKAKRDTEFVNIFKFCSEMLQVKKDMQRYVKKTYGILYLDSYYLFKELNKLNICLEVTFIYIK